MRWVVSLAACALLVGCGKDGTLQPATRNIEMTLTVSPRAADRQHPATIHAEVVNATADAWGRTEGCGVWGKGMGLEILDPESQLVHLWDPTTQPACADQDVTFESRERLQALAEFDGALYSSAGLPRLASSGTYTIVARFVATREGETRHLVRRAVLHWSAE